MPTPSATTQSVLTFMPMSSSTISEWPSSVTSTSGSSTHSAASGLRKLSQHIRNTAAYSRYRMVCSDARTVSLVAAMTPTLPVARRRFTWSEAKDGSCAACSARRTCRLPSV